MDSGNSPANSSLRKTALNALHKRLGAKMVNFGGWDMPVEYPCSGNLMCEHRAVRGGVGVFDVSHMGDIRIHGAKKPGGALAAVQHLTMNDASKLAIGQAQYSAMLYPNGTFVDDVIVHRRRVHATGDSGAAGGGRATEADGREAGDDQELLVHAWNGLRVAEYADCADGVYGRGRI